MSLFIVVRDNPYWDRLSYVEEVEPGMLQAQEMVKTEDGKWRPMYPYGLIIPMKDVRSAIMQVQQTGLDMEGLKG